MNVLLATCHSIEEYDLVKLFSGIGLDVFSLGAYIDPAHPHVDTRPPLPDVPSHPELRAAVDAIGAPDNIGAAQELPPAAILDWLGDDGVIVYDLPRFGFQWERLKKWRDGSSGRRIIWRSIGQSVEGNERNVQPYMDQGLERVLYSPKERNIPGFSGGDAPVIRFGKDPADWYGWTGDDARVLNIAQHAPEPHARDDWLNWQFWEEATRGLPAVFAGNNSENIGGLGRISYDDMRALLRACRVYLYTGTQPASYTLGLIEAMMTGIPVVSIGPEWMRIFPYGPAMFEAAEIVSDDGMDYGDANSIEWVRARLGRMMDYEAEEHSACMRRKAISLFGIDTIADQWAAYLGVKVAARA